MKKKVTFIASKKILTYQLLVCSVVISVELHREDYSSISRNCDHEGAEIT
jgi:hypothetical protein